jgi:two-component system sensor histidine kinase QseC
MRRFLLIALLATIALLALLESVWSHRQGVHEIDEVFDAQLAQYARILLGLIDHTSGQSSLIDMERRLAASEGFHSAVHHPYEAQLGFQVWNAGGELLGKSASLPVDRVVPLTPGFHSAAIADQPWRFFSLHDERHGRWLVAGQNSAVRSELAARFALHDVSTALALVLAMGAAVIMIMRLGLGPLDKLARQVSQRDADDLRPLDGTGLPLELQPLASSINGAFGLLESALERERQFASDAAHELCTPVAIIQTQLENALAEASIASEPALRSALDATRSLGQLIRQLLELARLSPESQRASYESVDLKQLVAEQIASHVAAIDDKQLDVSLAGEPGAQVSGNPRLLAILVRNLLDNAIKYTPRAGTIDIAVETREAMVELRIGDSGTGIPAEFRQPALQRFHRLPQQQADAGVAGSGLGLALVDMIARMHGASLTLGAADAGGLQVTLQFPVGSALPLFNDSGRLSAAR